jgi:hypothetical protein
MSAPAAIVLAVARRLHHGAIALVFAGVVLLLVLFVSMIALMSVLALLQGADLGGHIPGQYFGVIAVMIGLLDLAIAAWAGVWGYRLMHRPLEPSAPAA